MLFLNHAFSRALKQFSRFRDRNPFQSRKDPTTRMHLIVIHVDFIFYGQQLNHLNRHVDHLKWYPTVLYESDSCQWLLMPRSPCRSRDCVRVPALCSGRAKGQIVEFRICSSSWSATVTAASSCTARTQRHKRSNSVVSASAKKKM